MYNANYMEGVPVKIAEKYKPPPELYKLPQSLVNKLNLADNFYENSPNYKYDVQLERKALAKIDEWKRIRQRNTDARRERKAKRDLQRQEDEKRQRNLLMRVSYPSADDLSSSGSDDEADRLGETGEPNETAVVADNFPEICVTKSTNSFHNILQPTVLSNYSSPTMATTNNGVTNNLASLVKSNQSFNYKDFEDDTSSPFDNIELKTINDLDVLAQVLHNTQLKSTPDKEPEDCINESKVIENPTATSKDEGVDVVSHEHEYVQPEMMFHSENIPKHQNLPKFSYDLGNLNSAQEAQSKLSDYSAALRFKNSHGSPALSPQTFIGLEQQQQYHGFGNVHNYNISVHPKPLNVYSAFEKVNTIDSDVTHDVTKWKSVPDILKELRDEIRNSELRRTRNCSHNLGNASPKEEASPVEESRSNDTLVKDIFFELDSNAKQLAEQICSMGFPKPRVARIVQLLGADDKKIIEHLIPLSELADLGFDETKISEALLRHENNKNKALDDLIS